MVASSPAALLPNAAAPAANGGRETASTNDTGARFEDMVAEAGRAQAQPKQAQPKQAQPKQAAPSKPAPKAANEAKAETGAKADGSAKTAAAADKGDNKATVDAALAEDAAGTVEIVPDEAAVPPEQTEAAAADGVAAPVPPLAAPVADPAVTIVAEAQIAVAPVLSVVVPAAPATGEAAVPAAGESVSAPVPPVPAVSAPVAGDVAPPSETAAAAQLPAEAKTGQAPIPTVSADSAVAGSVQAAAVQPAPEPTIVAPTAPLVARAAEATLAAQAVRAAAAPERTPGTAAPVATGTTPTGTTPTAQPSPGLALLQLTAATGSGQQDGGGAFDGSFGQGGEGEATTILKTAASTASVESFALPDEALPTDSTLLALSQPSARAVAGQPVPVAPVAETPLPTVPVEALPRHIAQAAQAGQTQLTLALNPEGLGRLQVQLAFGGNGQVRAAFAVERSETAQAIERDRQGLVDAMKEAGYRLDPADVRVEQRQLDAQLGDQRGRDQQAPNPWFLGADRQDQGRGGERQTRAETVPDAGARTPRLIEPEAPIRVVRDDRVDLTV